MEATQLTRTIDKAIEKNATIQALNAEQHRQGVEQRWQSTTIQELKDEQHRQGAIIQELKDVQHRQGATIQGLKDGQHRQGVILEDMQGQIQMIAEAVTPLLRISEVMPAVESTLKSLSQENIMTQQALKHHIKDPHAHEALRKS